jgi:MYXO-CTERM domain-containing protein
MVWPPAMQLYFEGQPRGGTFRQSIGIYFDARLRWDIDIAGVGHTEGEMPIPFLPSIDVGCLDNEMQFTPFLLMGNPARPAQLHCEIPRIMLVEYDLLDLILPEISAIASVYVRVYMGVAMDSFFQGNKIIVSEHDQEITEEYGRVFVYPRIAPALTMSAQYIADLSHQIVVTLYPEVEFEILMFDYGFDIIDVNIPIPEITDQWVFDPAEMTFYFPDISVPDSLDFGRTQVGRPRLKRFPIENVGFQDLDVRARTALPFGVDAALGDPEEPPLTVPAPGLDDIRVSFDPSGEGRATGILRLETSDPDEPWVDVDLVGQATTEDVGVYDDPDDCEGDECDTDPVHHGDDLPGCGCSTPGSPGPWLPLSAFGLLLAARRLRRRPEDRSHRD